MGGGGGGEITFTSKMEKNGYRVARLKKLWKQENRSFPTLCHSNQGCVNYI